MYFQDLKQLQLQLHLQIMFLILGNICFKPIKNYKKFNILVKVQPLTWVKGSKDWEEVNFQIFTNNQLEIILIRVVVAASKAIFHNNSSNNNNFQFKKYNNNRFINLNNNFQMQILDIHLNNYLKINNQFINPNLLKITLQHHLNLNQQIIINRQLLFLLLLLILFKVLINHLLLLSNNSNKDLKIQLRDMQLHLIKFLLVNNFKRLLEV